MADSSNLAACRAAIEQAAESGGISPEAASNIKTWLEGAAFEPSRGALIDLIRQKKFAELEGLFWEVIPFGTGGRRGRMGALGTATINARTIAESAYGLAAYLRKLKGAAGGRAVVAYDTRHRSIEFAQIAATTLAASGLEVFLFDGPRATPELSFAVRRRRDDLRVAQSAQR
jgi:phosphoglucomutase